MLSLTPGTAKHYLTTHMDLPLKHAVRLLELSREYEAEWRELIVDLEAHIATRGPRKRGGQRVGGKTG